MHHRISKFLGSIQLAVPLLGAIAAILVFATFYESKVGSTTVQQVIYKSPWFGALMFLLALNLAISAFSRYPWRGARKVGFALTHFGLVVMITGAAAVIHLGAEGMLLLRVGGDAGDRIRVEGELLEVMKPGGEVRQANVFAKADGSIFPHQVGDLSLLAYTENAVKTVSFAEGATVDNPAVRLSLHSDRMEQTLERWIAAAPFAYSRIPIGPAELAIDRVENPTQLQQLLSPPAEKNIGRWGRLHLKNAEGETFDVDLEKNLGQTLKWGNFQVKLLDFWSDFRLDANNQPTSVSDRLDNPAVQLELDSPRGVEHWFAFGRNDFAPIASVISGEAIEGIEIDYEVQPQQSANEFRVLVNPDGQLFYTARSSIGFKSGELRLGEPIRPGWADFQITVEEFVPQAKLNRQVVPVAEAGEVGIPALLVETVEGTQEWLPWGEPTTIEMSDGELFAAFSPKMLQLPFRVGLKDFIVDRNEGSETVAMWTSTIRLADADNGVESQRDVWMNHPTWFHGWKIAQASWNPGDLQQSTLQVKREPLWVTALTWSGSAMMVLGIATMFYGGSVVKAWQRSKPKPEVILTDAAASSPPSA